jgi:quinoprotein glucose dehydrogenase
VHALARHESAAVRLAACLAMRRLRDDRIAECLADASPRVVLEAARAIHDLPLPAALPPLAEWAADGPADEAFMRRAISAAERVGTSAAADELVAVIARGDVSNVMRLQAVAALHDWQTPPPRNRVTGVWQPHAATRDVAAAQAAVRKEFATLAGAASKSGPKLDESVRSALLAAASALGIREVGPLLVSWCGDTSCSPASRARALESLVAAKDPAVGGIAATLVKDKSPIVREAAMRVRAGQLPAAEVVSELVAAVSSSDVGERQTAVRLLGGSDDPAAVAAVAKLVADLEADRVDAAIELEVNEAAAARLGEQTAAALAAARAAGADADAAWPPALRSWHDCLEGGDAARGREIFLANAAVACVRCHAVAGTGGEVGPKLDGIAGKRDRRHLLEALVLPDAQIAEGYGTTVIVTDEGRSFAGIIIAEDADRLKLRTADGKVEEIAIASIEDRARGPSAMPADLATKLSRRDLRDVIAWLASLR